MTPSAPGSTKIKVILAEDDADLLKAMAKTLTDEGFEVVACTSGLGVVEHLGAGDANTVVVTDINMPEMRGDDVLAEIKKRGLPTKVILVTGFLAENDANKLIDAGCFGFLAKPVQKGELLGLIYDAVHLGSDSGNTPANYAAIPVDHFISGSSAASSVYLRFADGRFVKLAHAGSELNLQRLNQFKAKGVSELWINIEDLPRYSKISASLVAKASTMKGPAQLKILALASEVAIENLRLMGLSADSINEGVGVFKSVTTSFLAKSENVAILDLLNESQASVYSHMATCGSLAASLTQVMAWTSPKIVEALTLAAFLHDIGLYKLPQHLQTVDTSALNEEDLKTYKQHPALGYELLKQIKDIPEEVSLAIRDHHEDGTPDAYPGKTGRSELSQLTKVLILVDYFSEFWIRQSPQRKVLHTTAIDTLSGLTGYPIDHTAYDALRILFGSKTIGEAKKKFLAEQSRRKG